VSSADPAPLVRAVVVSYEGGDLTLQCLRSLVHTAWPVTRLEIVLVDNGSKDGVADKVERELPVVKVIRNSENLGFAGGCNVGFKDLGDVQYIALVNNDATVEPGWLGPLVDALEADAELGAACPKIVLSDRYREVALQSPTRRRGGGDARDLGVWVSGARVDGADVWPRRRLASGFWGTEPPPRQREPGQWTSGDARVLVPDGERAELRVGANWVEVPFTGDAHDIINNTGNVLTDDWYGADRGYLEPDRGQYDEPIDVFAWCGAATLLRRAYLDDVGVFDDDLFLCYEDFELSWRGRDRGWRSRYIPTSVVRHVHMATTGQSSEIRDHYNDRNRLLVLARHAPKGVFRRALWQYAKATASYAKRDILSRALRGETPRGQVVGRRLRALIYALIHTGEAFSKRRADKRRAERART
jgi:GT2 family glycosyltransferase